MNSREFYSRVVKHPGLEWLGVKENCEDLGAAVVVQDRGRGTKWALALAAIRDNSWETLEALLTNKRPAKLMTHLSRIVGYFSRISNWNRSKLAELRDRHKGDYTIKDQPKKKKVMVPGTVGRQSVGAEERIRTSTPEGAAV